MGKYMKKSKITGDIAVMEVSQSSLGVRTRAAKTLALQRIHKTSPSSQQVAPNPDASSLCYLQLRSRRLEKQPSPLRCETSKKQQHLKESCKGETKNADHKPNPRTGSRLRMVSVSSGPAGSEVGEERFDKSGEMVKPHCQEEEAYDVGLEVSFGENNLDFEARDRSTRESTPSSLIRNSENIATPGSTTRRTSNTRTHRQVENDVRRFIPSTHEMEEFFASAEQQHRRQFIDKYNFDFVNDLPLPGRYEWLPIDSIEEPTLSGHTFPATI